MKVSEQDIIRKIRGLDSSKKCSDSIPVKILKLAAEKSAPVLTYCFNDAIENSFFPDELKLADIIPIHKKGSTTDKANYRPISLLPAISKVYERLVSKQMTTFLDSKLSQYLCGFRKGFSSQYALLKPFI